MSLYEDHVDLYDRAFGPPSAETLAWLGDQFGAGCRAVLEPGCGTGRILEGLARAGYEVTGFDRSPAMVARARERLAREGLAGTVTRADMADFDLARVFDAALCPIDTITYLSPPEAARHLEAMGRHLRPGAPYLVEVVLDDPGAPPVTRWRSGHTGVEVSSEWTTLEPGRVRARLEVLDGPEAGRVVDEVHVMTAWTPEAWAALVAASPLELEGTVEQSGRFWQRLVASRA